MLCLRSVDQVLMLTSVLTSFNRADWFLLDSIGVRHVAIGLFCLGVSVYLIGKRSRLKSRTFLKPLYFIRRFLRICHETWKQVFKSLWLFGKTGGKQLWCVRSDPVDKNNAFFEQPWLKCFDAEPGGAGRWGVRWRQAFPCSGSCLFQPNFSHSQKDSTNPGRPSYPVPLPALLRRAGVHGPFPEEKQDKLNKKQPSPSFR